MGKETGRNKEPSLPRNAPKKCPSYTPAENQPMRFPMFVPVDSVSMIYHLAFAHGLQARHPSSIISLQPPYKMTLHPCPPHPGAARAIAVATGTSYCAHPAEGAWLPLGAVQWAPKVPMVSPDRLGPDDGSCSTVLEPKPLSDPSNF